MLNQTCPDLDSGAVGEGEELIMGDGFGLEGDDIGDVTVAEIEQELVSLSRFIEETYTFIWFRLRLIDTGLLISAWRV
jgi:hypothetical protein